MQALSSILDEGSNWVALQVDFRNAFNTLDRTTLLLSAAKRVPSAYNYLRFAYGTAAPLYVGGTSLLSQTGTHQGCPLGPLGFALGLQDITEEIAQKAGLLWSVWYLDDGLLVGDPARIQTALTFLEDSARLRGLELNRKKCVLWGPGALQVPDHTTMLVSDWRANAGITVLGIPVDRKDCNNETAQAS